MNDTNIYNLALNHQTDLIDLLNIFNVDNPKEKIKKILDVDLFEVIESNEYEILTIKKKSTGEIFRKGCGFYHIKYDSWIENCYFNTQELLGVSYFDKYYRNYIRGSGGLYHLNEISLTEQQPEHTEELNFLFIN